MQSLISEEKIEHNNCGTPKCCGECETSINKQSLTTLTDYIEKADRIILSKVV
jgi:hypothetical protein